MKKFLLFILVLGFAFGDLLDDAENAYCRDDWGKAWPLYQASCESNIAGGCFTVGIWHRYGQMVEEDHAKANEYFTKALNLATKGCENGVARDCNTMGDLYSFDRTNVFKADSQKSFVYYQKACDMSYGEACATLGDSYEKSDSKKAFDYYAKACDNGGGEGCWKIGQSYENNNNQKAYEYYKKVAT